MYCKSNQDANSIPTGALNRTFRSQIDRCVSRGVSVGCAVVLTPPPPPPSSAPVPRDGHVTRAHVRHLEGDREPRPAERPGAVSRRDGGVERVGGEPL